MLILTSTLSIHLISLILTLDYPYCNVKIPITKTLPSRPTDPNWPCPPNWPCYILSCDYQTRTQKTYQPQSITNTQISHMAHQRPISLLSLVRHLLSHDINFQPQPPSHVRLNPITLLRINRPHSIHPSPPTQPSQQLNYQRLSNYLSKLPTTVKTWNFYQQRHYFITALQ